MILFNFEEIIHYSLTWLRFILLSCRLRLSHFFSFCFSQLLSVSSIVKSVVLSLFDFMRWKEVLWQQVLIYFSYQAKNQKQGIGPSVEAKPTTDLCVTIADQLWIKQVNRQTACLSLSLSFMSLITTWRNVHYFSSAVFFFLSEPLLEEQESETARSYCISPPWHKSWLIIMLKLPAILKGKRERQKEGSKHSRNLNQLCELHSSCCKKHFFVFSFLITGLGAF